MENISSQFQFYKKNIIYNGEHVPETTVINRAVVDLTSAPLLFNKQHVKKFNIIKKQIGRRHPRMKWKQVTINKTHLIFVYWN